MKSYLVTVRTAAENSCFIKDGYHVIDVLLEAMEQYGHVGKISVAPL
jgi:hypothetical protein